MNNPWSTLGLKQGASIEEIKKAYRKLCLLHHPDLVQDINLRSQAEHSFKQITFAYTTLTRRTASGHALHSSTSTYPPYPPNHQWARRANTIPKFSNGVIACIISTPLLLLGWWAARTRGADNAAGNRELDMLRPNGILYPPVNEFLRDDVKPRIWKRGGG